jgi:hypothetical protein
MTLREFEFFQETSFSSSVSLEVPAESIMTRAEGRWGVRSGGTPPAVHHRHPAVHHAGGAGRVSKRGAAEPVDGEKAVDRLRRQCSRRR